MSRRRESRWGVALVAIALSLMSAGVAAALPATSGVGPPECGVRLEAGGDFELGYIGPVTVNGVTFSFTAWVTKPGEPGEYMGFSWSDPQPPGSTVTFTVKSGSDPVETVGPFDDAGSWQRSGGPEWHAIAAISHIDPCATAASPEYGRIVVDKVTDPAGDLTEFEFDPSWGQNFFLADGDAPYNSGDLLVGTYGVSEVNLPAGWSLTGATCDDGSDPAAIELGADEVVTCTFTNLNPPEGSITIVKDAITSDPSVNDTPFSFEGDLGPFTLMDPSDPSHTAGGLLVPFTYVVSEGDLPEGWVFQGVECVGVESWSADGATVTINLTASDAAVCTFTNFYEGTQGPEGSLTIVKDAFTNDPARADTPFTFEGDLGGFVLMDPSDPAKTFTPLPAGTYQISESDLPPGWAFSEVECDALSWSADGQGVTVNLTEGEVAVCTFHNLDTGIQDPDGSLTIIKDASPGDDTEFTFDGGSLGTFTLKDPSGPSKAFTQLAAGTYSVTEGPLSGAWELVKVECTALSWSADGSTVTVNLTEGEVAVCTFFNEGELPFTGPSPMLPLMFFAGLGLLLVGTGLLGMARRREVS